MIPLAKCLLRLFIILLFLFSTSCGYQFGQGRLPAKYHTICIPYVDGDTTGELTAALIKQITRSGAFRYVREGGDLLLNVSVCECAEDNIGFRYDRKREEKKETKSEENDDANPEVETPKEEKDEKLREKLNHSIIPIETRAYITAEVCVVDNCTGSTLLGPVRLLASVDFDHEYYYSPNQINSFSLGQLTDIETARDAVQRPLYNALAEKITAYIVHSW